MAQKWVRLTSGQKRIIINVRSFFEKEKDQQWSIKTEQVVARTSIGTWVGETTIKKISKEYREEGQLESPMKRYTMERVRLYFNREALRHTLHQFYLDKDYPTLDKVLRRVKRDGIFEGGRTTLSKLLKSMGFRYKIREDGKRYIYMNNLESSNSDMTTSDKWEGTEKRKDQRYTWMSVTSLGSYYKANASLVYDYQKKYHPKNVNHLYAQTNHTGNYITISIYHNETWTNSHSTPERIWVDRDGFGGWRRPSEKGERLIIIPAGSATGWIPNVGEHFRSKKKSLHYHDEMNAARFLEWFEYCLIPDLPPHSLIILDNAKYRNTIIEKIPTKSSTKRVMKQYNHGVTYYSKDLRKISSS